MIFPGTALSLRNSFFRRHDLGGRIGVGVASRCMTAAAALVAVTLPLSFAHAQTPPLNPTSPTVDCPNPVSQDLVMPPEIKSDKGVLKGTVRPHTCWNQRTNSRSLLKS